MSAYRELRGPIKGSLWARCGAGPNPVEKACWDMWTQGDSMTLGIGAAFW